MLVEYITHTKEQTWEQLMFTIAPKAAVEKGSTQWIAARTNNNKTFSSVVLEQGTKARLVEDLQGFLDSEDLYKNLGISWTRGYLLHGLPGCGKSSIVKALSNTAKMNIYNLDLTAVRDDDHLQTLFQNIPQRAVVLIEDVDCMSNVVHKRGEDGSRSPTPELEDEAQDLVKFLVSSSGSSSHKQSKMTLSGLLNQLDGVCVGHGRILIMTSNHPEKLDPALVRPGRIDLQLELGCCTRQQVADFYRLFFGKGCEVPEALHGIAEDLLTPAEVSNAFLTHRKDSEAAVAAVLALSTLKCKK